jgi:hypothetical protein
MKPVRWLGAAMVATACSPAPAAPAAHGGGAAPSAPAANGPGSAAASAPSEGGRAMIDELLDLGRLLSQEPLTMEQVIARVGPVTDDGGRDRAWELRPKDPRWRSARVARDRDTGAPFLVELAPAQVLTLAALRARLGDYQMLRGHEDLPRQVMFRLPDADLPYRAALIASLADSDTIDGANVVLVGVRRDPRL